MTDQPEITIACPECGRPLVERINRLNASTFLGCSGYPDFCSHTQKVPAFLEVKRAGGIPLPGFGDDDAAPSTDQREDG